MAWVKDVYRDEIRSGFLVTAHRKRIWDIELNMLAELERICEKYHLRYFAAWGTLLGAVRHGGFVPWDDDMDLVMMRPDYERFKEVAAQELAEPYFFQTAYTDGALFGIARLRNSATMAMLPDINYFNQGIFIDIHPLDAVHDGGTRMEELRSYQMELYALAMEEDRYREAMAGGVPLVIAPTERERILRLPLRERFRLYEEFQLAHFDDSQRVNYYPQEFPGRQMTLTKKLFSRILRLPFEQTTVPVPAAYEEAVQIYYASSWRQLIRGDSTHEGLLFSPDVSYQAYQAAQQERRFPMP